MCTSTQHSAAYYPCSSTHYDTVPPFCMQQAFPAPTGSKQYSLYIAELHLHLKCQQQHIMSTPAAWHGHAMLNSNGILRGKEPVSQFSKVQHQLVPVCASTQHTAANYPSSTIHTVLHAASNTDYKQKNCTHLWNARANRSSKQHNL